MPHRWWTQNIASFKKWWRPICRPGQWRLCPLLIRNTRVIKWGVPPAEYDEGLLSLQYLTDIDYPWAKRGGALRGGGLPSCHKGCRGLRYASMEEISEAFSAVASDAGALKAKNVDNKVCQNFFYFFSINSQTRILYNPYMLEVFSLRLRGHFCYVLSGTTRLFL